MLNDFGGFPNLLSYKIALDRYAAKDEQRNIQNGDLVLCLMDLREGVGKRELGIVINNGEKRDQNDPHGVDDIEVKLQTGFVMVDGEKQSLEGETRIFHKSQLDKPTELTAEQIHKRVVTAVSIDTDGNLDTDKYENYMRILHDWSFVPAGRLLSGLGFQNQLILFNCFVLPSPKDSRNGINKTLGLMTELMARGGGVGINLSSLRPRGALVRGVRGRSSGAVSWGDEYSRRTGRVEQGGCIDGDTLVATSQGNIAIKNLVGTTPWIYTYCSETKKIKLRKATWVGKTGSKKEIWKLITDRGLTLYATPDHKILMSNGYYEELKNIKIGQSIMSIIRGCLDKTKDNKHKVLSIAYSHKVDVYDLEVPATHNFAIVRNTSSDIIDGIFIHNSRRGALLLMLADWHPDIIEFIEAKQQSRELKLALQQLNDAERAALKVPMENCNISVAISNAFMKAVEEDKDWHLEFPDTTVENYTELWNGDLKSWKDNGGKTIIYKTMKARELWDILTRSSWDSGEPGIVFLERYNELSNTKYYKEGKIVGTNPCITGDTLIATADGRQIVPIKQLAEEGKDIPVFCNDKKGGTRIRLGRNPRKTGEQKEVWKVVLDDGSYFRSTPDHKVILRTGKEISIKELNSGDSLMPFAKGFYSNRNRDDWWVNSFDSLHDGKHLEAHILAEYMEGRFPNKFPSEVVHHKNSNHYDNKPENIEIIANKVHSKEHSAGSGNPMYGKVHSKETKEKIAASSQERFSDSNKEWKKSFSNAVKLGVNKPESKARCRKAAYNRVFNCALRQGKWVIEQFGDIDPSKWKEHKELFRKATGLTAVNSWIIEDRFDSWEAFTDEASNYNHRVVSVSFDGYEDVYNITVDEYHNYAIVTNTQYRIGRSRIPRIGLGGVILRNCGEQGLAAHGDGIGVCNLGHLNLTKFLKSDFVDFNNLELHEAYNYIKDQINWEKLENTIRWAVRFLDHVYDLAHFIHKEHAKSALGERRIGLGTIGLAEMLIRLGITYGDNPLCLELIDTLYNFIQMKAYDESMKIAEQLGAYHFCNPEKLKNMPMIKKLGIQHKILNCGIRNATITTQAPTGTVGTMLNTSTGIEPFPFFEWQLQTNIGEHNSTASVLDNWCEKHMDQDIPDFFVSSMGPRAISPKDHAAVQTAIQKWTDSSISKTCNMPNSATIEDVALYFTYLYANGAKGGTVYRDGCRDKQVLSAIKQKQENKENILVVKEEDREDYRTAPSLIGRPSWTVGINTAMGHMYVVISFYKGPYEIFILIGKAGSELYSHCEAMGRLISAFLQLNSHVPPVNRLHKLFKHLKDIGGSNQFGVGPKKVKSIPDGVGKAIELFLEEHPDGVLNNCNGERNEEEELVMERRLEFDICPQCGTSNLKHEAGCESCTCGYSRC